MLKKRFSSSETLLKAGFLSLLAGLFALLMQAVFGSPKMAIEGGDSQMVFLVLFGAFLVVVILGALFRAAKSASGGFLAKGLYKFVRYPIYGAIIFLLNPGLAILLRSWFLIFACVFAYFIWRKIVRTEERERREIFGDAYLKYQKNASLFFPNLFAVSRPLFFGFWVLAVFIFIFVGLNYSAFYLRAVEWPQNEPVQPVSSGPIRANHGDPGGGGAQGGNQNVASLPSVRPRYNKPNSIVIEKLKIEAPLVFASGTGQKELNVALDQGVVIYPGSKLPDEPGEVFLTGHSSVYPWNKTSYGQVFTLLDKLEAGDIVIIYYDKYKYDYKVTKKTVVKPSELHLNSQTSAKTITLMTCWPPGTTLKRLVVEGEEVD